MSNFVRQLGSQPGTQLNPIKDESGSTGNLGNWDRTVGMAIRSSRGRIDKAFRVRASNFASVLGSGESIALSQLNEGKVIADETLRRGALSLVVSRLHGSDAVVSWLVFHSHSSSTFEVSDTEPSEGYTLAVKHIECFNDGIALSVHADANGETTNKNVTVVIKDSKATELFRIAASLDPLAKDDSGKSAYLPDVSERLYGDLLEWSVPEGAAIGSTHSGYGNTSAGKKKWAESDVLVCFDEGGTAYTSTDYASALTKLRNTDLEMGSLISAGSRSVDLVSGLIELGYDRNRQVFIDIPGDLSPSAAAAWKDQFDVGGVGHDHYPIFLWAPIRALDMLNGGMAVYGTSGNKAGQACARNAVTNSYGYAAKNKPIAGKDYPLGRASIRVIHSPTTDWEDVRSDCADARINPVLPQVFADGVQTVFGDCLTAANSTTSWRKLETVAAMSSHLDERVCRLDQETRFLPQSEKKRTVERNLESIFSGAAASGWLVTGTDEEGGEISPYEYAVEVRQVDGVDTIYISYWLHFDGVNRRTFVQQTLR